MSSSAEYSVPVSILQYRDMSGLAEGVDSLHLPDVVGGSRDARKRREVEQSEAELAARVARERADAARETEQMLRKEYEQKLIGARAPIAAAITGFEQQRDQYFAKVEAEAVQLALAIAAKILHREAQVDSLLVAALVRIAMENMREGSSVTIRVSAGKGAAWKQYFANATSASHVEIAEDAQLTDNDCLVETELGSANFGLDAQLKEVEQGFFDLLALRPASR